MYESVIKYLDVFALLLIFLIPFLCLMPKLVCDLPRTQVTFNSKGRGGDYLCSVLKYDTGHKTLEG